MHVGEDVSIRAEEDCVAGHVHIGFKISGGLAVFVFNAKAKPVRLAGFDGPRSEEHTSELQSHSDLVCRLLLEKKKKQRRRALTPTMNFTERLPNTVTVIL